MSSAINHKKRSRYSHQMRGAAFRASSRQAYYRDVNDRRNRGALGILGKLFHRRSPKQAESAPNRGAEA